MESLIQLNPPILHKTVIGVLHVGTLIAFCCAFQGLWLFILIVVLVGSLFFSLSSVHKGADKVRLQGQQGIIVTVKGEEFLIEKTLWLSPWALIVKGRGKFGVRTFLLSKDRLSTIQFMQLYFFARWLLPEK